MHEDLDNASVLLNSGAAKPLLPGAQQRTPAEANNPLPIVLATTVGQTSTTSGCTPGGGGAVFEGAAAGLYGAALRVAAGSASGAWQLWAGKDAATKSLPWYIRGGAVEPVLPVQSGAPCALAPQRRDWDLLLTAETHNFPCAVAPYPGAPAARLPAVLLESAADVSHRQLPAALITWCARFLCGNPTGFHTVSWCAHNNLVRKHRPCAIDTLPVPLIGWIERVWAR